MNVARREMKVFIPETVGGSLSGLDRAIEASGSIPHTPTTLSLEGLVEKRRNDDSVRR
jgi:hypothetical protein